MAVANLSPQHIPHDVLGDQLRFTRSTIPELRGLNLGSYSRGLHGLTFGALVVLGRLYQATRQGDASALSRSASSAAGRSAI